MAIRSVSKLRRTESLGAASMATLKSESDTTDDDYIIEGGNNFSELDYKVIKKKKLLYTCNLLFNFTYVNSKKDNSILYNIKILSNIL